MSKPVQFDRDHVLEKLVPLFIRKGYSGTSMQDIVDASGLNRSSIYNSFGEKNKLYHEVIRYYVEVQSANMRTLFSGSENAKEALQNFFQMLFRAEEQGNSIGCLITKSCVETDINTQETSCLLKKNMQSVTDVFCRILKSGQQQGTINTSIDPESYAVFLYNNLQGLRLLSVVAEDKKDTDTVIDLLFKPL